MYDFFLMVGNPDLNKVVCHYMYMYVLCNHIGLSGNRLGLVCSIIVGYIVGHGN